MPPPRGQKLDAAVAPEAGASARVTFASRALAVVVPAMLAAAHVEHVPDAAHDLGVARTLGLGWTGAFRELDAFAAAVFAWLPIGTRAFRAGLATAVLCGVGAGLVFELAWRLIALVAPRATRLGPPAAAVAALTAGLSVAWQLESASPGGAVLGAVLSLAPLVLVASAKSVQDAPIGALGVSLGLAATYDQYFRFNNIENLFRVYVTAFHTFTFIAVNMIHNSFEINNRVNRITIIDRVSAHIQDHQLVKHFKNVGRWLVNYHKH